MQCLKYFVGKSGPGKTGWFKRTNSVELLGTLLTNPPVTHRAWEVSPILEIYA